MINFGPSAFPTSTARQTAHENLRTLVLGDAHAWANIGKSLPQIKGFRFIDINALKGDVFNMFPANVVLSPLMVRGQDVVEIAHILDALSFKGRYRALTSGLPFPDIINNEVKAAAPCIDFAVLNMPRDDYSA